MDILQTSQLGELADLSGVDALQDMASSKANSDSAKLEDVARKFEGLLLNEVFKQVQRSVETLNDDEDDDSGMSAGREQYQSLFWSQMADAISSEGGIGLWKNIYSQISPQSSTAGISGGSINEGV